MYPFNNGLWSALLKTLENHLTLATMLSVVALHKSYKGYIYVYKEMNALYKVMSRAYICVAYYLQNVKPTQPNIGFW